jgi:hypothetical protein
LQRYGHEKYHAVFVDSSERIIQQGFLNKAELLRRNLFAVLR